MSAKNSPAERSWGALSFRRPPPGVVSRTRVGPAKIVPSSDIALKWRRWCLMVLALGRPSPGLVFSVDGDRRELIKEIGDGKAGAEHPGFIPQQRPQGQDTHHHLSVERREAHRPHPLVR